MVQGISDGRVRVNGDPGAVRTGSAKPGTGEAGTVTPGPGNGGPGQPASGQRGPSECRSTERQASERQASERQAGQPSAGPAGTGAARGGMPAVLMYHSVEPYATDPYLVTVSPPRFEQQMRWLSRRGLRGTSMRELLAARAAGTGKGLVGLTFDDGYTDFAEHALPVLRRYGFGATVFVIAGRLGGDNGWDPAGPRKPLMDASQVRSLADAGIEIGSHGLRHVPLPAAPATLAEEIEHSRDILQDVTGQPVAGFCYPYGAIDAEAVDGVRDAGYDYGCAIWASAYAGRHALPRTYIGDRDTPPRLWAKAMRHWLTWQYRGPAAGRLGPLSA
jgi:peptidoglycan/xylan/chitin deacetylase (PgdA/CDA1 family)